MKVKKKIVRYRRVTMTQRDKLNSCLEKLNCTQKQFLYMSVTKFKKKKVK